MRIYLEDEQGILYLYECALPKSLQKLSASDYLQADKYKDAIFWATDLVEHTIETFPVTEDILDEFDLTTSSRALDEYSTWIPNDGYRDTFYVGTTKNICSSLPYLNYMHSNIESSADTTWVASFRIAEHNNCGGTTLYGFNSFYYIELDLSVGCGDHTTILRIYHEGRMYKNIYTFEQLVEDGGTLTIGLLGFVSSQVHIGSTLATVFNALNSLANLTPVSEEIILGNNGCTLFDDTVLAVRERFSNVKLDECTKQNNVDKVGHYYTMQVVVKRQGQPTNTITSGLLTISFEVWNNLEKYQTVTANFPLGYTVYGN